MLLFLNRIFLDIIYALIYLHVHGSVGFFMDNIINEPSLVWPKKVFWKTNELTWFIYTILTKNTPSTQLKEMSDLALNIFLGHLYGTL